MPHISSQAEMIDSGEAPLAPHAERVRERRAALRRAVRTGLIVIPGHATVWRNADNPFPFRQSSHLLYLAPILRPGIVLVLDADRGEDVVFGPPEDPDDLIWHGPGVTLAEEALASGITEVRELTRLGDFLQTAESTGRQVHLLPAFIPESRAFLTELLDSEIEDVDERVSGSLVHAMGELRLRKSPDEVEEIERALAVTAEMFAAGFTATRSGIREAAVRAAMAQVVYSHDLDFSFAPIVTVRGEVLHNHSYANTLREGDLLLIDAGVETARGYASDITRTIPVSGSFTDLQREIYQIVLAAEESAIKAMRPGVRFREIHDLASRTIAQGLIDVGLMRGGAADAVEAGAHALFFVHGLGHPLGLDVHDLHDLGDAVAYPPDVPRSNQFGTRFLRFGREVAEGMVMTVEPGVYFIPALIDLWKSERRFKEFINYDMVERYRDFGGIRIEDDVLVTGDEARVLSSAIPRMPDDVEVAVMSGRH
jgi:Xaa-Pro aminopeptidase